MDPIKETFEAFPLSIVQVFQYQMGSTSYRVPIYQRNFRWPNNRIDRLFEDINDGLSTLNAMKGDQTLTFLGTLILVDDNYFSEQGYPGNSMAVVDGQQRLTTLALTICEIHKNLFYLKKCLDEDDKIDCWLLEESEDLRYKLFFSFTTSKPHTVVRDPYEYIPAIVREEDDFRSTSKERATYDSPVADYLFQYAYYVWNNLGQEEVEEFEFYPRENSERQSIFNDKLVCIRSNVNKIGKANNSSEEETILSAPDLVYDDNYRKLYNILVPRHESIIKEFKNIKEKDIDPTRSSLIKLIAFGNYLLERVAITFVSVKDERYAFDIFEALNTTGESLTAIETFKPIVIYYEDKERDTRTGYKGSLTEQCFEEIDEFIYKESDSQAQQKKSKDLIILHALYSCGLKQSGHLSFQRRYLQNNYKKQNTPDSRQRFVRLLHDLVDFQKRFWEPDAFNEFLNFGLETQLCYCCLGLISQMKTSIAIPALTRYWINDKHKDDFSTFIDAVKAITAFIVLRRSSTGGTANIDSDFRSLMQKGHRNKSKESKPLMAGLGDDQYPLPSINELRDYLKSYLEYNVKVKNKSDWLNRMYKQPLKNYSNPLCRFLLLASARNSQQMHSYPYLLQRASSEPALDFLSWEVWRHDDFQSLEHVAPESGGGGVWSTEIYKDPSLRHTIGNLALLPIGANSAVGKASPKQKWLMYQALSAKDEQNAEYYIELANTKGVRFSERLKHIIRNGRRIPGVAGIGKATKWDSKAIEDRSWNIGERAWEEIAPWLDYDPELNT
jgi:uncharacterized protein with ParB-like and HNH nuclease domain